MHEDGEGRSHVMDMHDQNLGTPLTTGARPRSRKRILADADTQVTPPKRISTATYKTPPRSSGCQKTPTKKRNVHTQVARRKDSATNTGSFNSHSLVDKCVGNHTDMCEKQQS